MITKYAAPLLLQR